MFSPKANANGSQFLITLRDFPEGNGRFVVFGTLVKGHELLRVVRYSHIAIVIQRFSLKSLLQMSIPIAEQ